MPDKRPYLLKSLLYVYVILVLISNIHSLLQHQQQQFINHDIHFEDSVSEDSFLELLKPEHNKKAGEDTTLTKTSLIVSFGLSEPLHTKLNQYHTKDSLGIRFNYVAYPLLGNNTE